MDTDLSPILLAADEKTILVELEIPAEQLPHLEKVFSNHDDDKVTLTDVIHSPHLKMLYRLSSLEI